MNTGNRPLDRYARLLVTLVIYGVVHTTTLAGEWQSHDSIRAAAQAYVEASLTGKGDRTRVQAAKLDARLKLPACADPLHTESPWGQSRGNRITVRVSCPGARNWRIHVPVEIVTFGNVVATARALARGAVLRREDLAFVETELGRLGHGYFLDASNVVGQRLKRPIPSGNILTPAQLETPPAILRGQNVTIVANSGVFGVKMNGKALENGAVGQVIDIENASSGRRVQGVVRSARAVEILLR
ncbi:MAG: flagellar basal body P-ring formation chaperone FlgA [Gammaproteobacteria bacterium]|jgi:flagella basal body P-ring formation protein FlgA